MDAQPLYGRWNLPIDASLTLIHQRLDAISEEFLRGAAFRAYVVDSLDQVYYDLQFHEIIDLKEKEIPFEKIAWAAVADNPHEVIRIKLTFSYSLHIKEAQYVIATSSYIKNETIRKLLALPIERLLQSRKIAQVKKLIYRELQGITTIQTENSIEPPTLNSFQADIPIVLVDHFRFDLSTSIECILDFLDKVSSEFFDDQSFHAELKTIPGDFYFDISRQELIYLFHHQKHTILSLSLDIQSSKGYWLYLFLSFNPLIEGPNAKVELSGLEHILERMTEIIWKSLAIQWNQGYVQPFVESFSLQKKDRLVETIVELFSQLSHRYLYRIPPLVEMETVRGDRITGLSIYQVRRIISRKASGIKWMRLYIYRIITRQELSMQVNMLPLPEAELSINWGDAFLHRKIVTYIKKRLSID